MKKSKILKIFSYLVMLMAFVFVGSILSGNSASATIVYYDANKTRYKQVDDLQEAITSCKESKLKLLSYSSSYCVIYMEEDYDNTSEQLFISDNIILYTEGYNIYTSIFIGNDGSNDIPASLIIRNTTDTISNIGNYSLIQGSEYNSPTITVGAASKLDVRGNGLSDGDLNHFYLSYHLDKIYTTTNIIIFSSNEYSAIVLNECSIVHIYMATIMDKAPDGSREKMDEDVGLFSANSNNPSTLLAIKSGEMFFSSEYLVTGGTISVEISGFQQEYAYSYFTLGREQIFYPYLYVENYNDYFKGILENTGTALFGNFSIISPASLGFSVTDSYGNIIGDVEYEESYTTTNQHYYYSTYLANYGPDDVYEISSEGDYIYHADVSSCITIKGAINTVILDFAGHNVGCGETNVITIEKNEAIDIIIMNANIFLSSSSQNAFYIDKSDNCNVYFFNVSVFALELLEDAHHYDFNPIVAGTSGNFSGNITLADTNSYESGYLSELIENYRNIFPDLLYFQNYFFGSAIYSLIPIDFENSAVVVNDFEAADSSSYNSYISSADSDGVASLVTMDSINESEIYGYIITNSISYSFIQCNSSTCNKTISASSSKVTITNSTIRTKGTIVGENTTIQIDDTNTFLYGETVFASTSTSKIISGLTGYIVFDDTTDSTHSHKIYLKISDKNVLLTKNGADEEFETISEALASASSTDSIKIKLNKDITECVTFSTTIKNVEFDLNGKTWTCSSGVAFNVSGGTSNTSTIVIDDSTSSVGIITASSGYTIKLEFSGTFNLYKGKIINTSGSGTIFATTYANTINIGDSSSTTTNLQVLNTGSGSSIVIDDLGSPSIILNVNRGLIVGKTWTIHSNSASSTINIGNSGSTPTNLKIISTSTSSGYYGVQAKTGASFNFKGGFIGSAAGASQAYNRTPTISNGVAVSTTTTYNGTTYQGKIVAVAHIGSTYYLTLSEAVSALSSSTSSTIVLDADITEKVTISSTKIGIIDLNGKTWTATSSNALYISGGTSNNSDITITDTSGSVGIIASKGNAISASFIGTLTILKGAIKTTSASSSSFSAIRISGAAIINIGDSSSTTSNLQILNILNTTGGYAIYSNAASTININNGLIASKTYGIYSSSSSSTVNIGTSYSTKDTLQVISSISKSSTSSNYFGVYTSSSATFKFNGGFIGDAFSGADGAYSETPTLQSGYSLADASITYDGETINGYEITRDVVAHIGSTYYSTLTEGVLALNSTSKTLVLDKNITECVSVTATIIGTIDLNGKTWSNCSNGKTLNIEKFNNASNLIITDSTSNVGTISSAYSSDVIANRDGTLTILKGIIQTTATSGNSVPIWIAESTAKLVIGNSSSTINNLKILNLSGGASGPAIQTLGDVTINNGLIVGNSNTIYTENSSASITIGASYSTTNSLRVISTSTSTSYWGIYVLGTFTFNGGFIGAGAGATYAYSKTPSFPSGKTATTTSVTYNGTAYNGKTLATQVAHIGSTGYVSLNDAFANMTSTSTTLVLDSDVTECISASGKKGIIDLNGHTWSCTQAYETLLALTSSSNITITDNSSGSVGKMISTYNTITVSSSTLNVYKGIIQSTSIIASYRAIYGISSAKITIGNSSSTTTNLQISANGYQTINVSSTSTLTINNGTITKTGSGGDGISNAIYSTGSGTYVYIYKGYIISDIDHVVYVDGGSILLVGNSSSTKDNLKIINTKSGTSYGVYNNSSHFTFAKGFIGSAGGSSYAYGGTSPTISGGVVVSTTTTYNSTTYQGKIVAVAHIGSTYYSTLSEAVSALNSSTSSTIVLDANITEGVTISSTKKGIINLNGKTWTGNGNALYISGGTSNNSNITITDTSSSVGTITATSDTISTSFAGTLTILKGIIKNTNSSTNYAAIWNTAISIIEIGDSNSTISNLQILNNKGYGIYSSAAGTININNGLVVGNTYGIYSRTTAATTTIGADYSTKSTLQVISTGTTSGAFGVYVYNLNYNNGFMGSGAGAANGYAYSGTLTGSASCTTSVTYNSTTYNGRVGAIASIGSTEYASLADAVNALTTSSSTIKLLRDTKECVTISSAKKGIIDLNGKTWNNCSSGSPALNMKYSTASITIQSAYNNVGYIISNSYTIKLQSGTLTIKYVVVQSTSSSSSDDAIYVFGGTLNIQSDTSSNYYTQILANAGRALYISSGTVYITSGRSKIESQMNNAIYINGSSSNVTINNGLIISNGQAHTINAIGSSTLSLGQNLGRSTHNLYIINNNSSTSYYGVYSSSSTVNFVNGFIGSAAGASYAYNSVTISNGVAYTTSYTYNGTTYSGKSLAVAHIGSTYYNYISAAFNALDNTTTKTIVLDANFETNQISINSAVKGIIDLNGKTLSSTYDVLNIASASNITITNSTSTIGKISSMSTYGGYSVINISDGATLKILKGIIESDTSVYISGTSHLTTYHGIVNVDNATLIVGDSSSTTSNLQLIVSGYASVINAKSNANITINNGKLSNTYSDGSFYNYANVIYNESTGNTITINKGILSSTKGYGIYLGSAVSSLTIGNENSTISNLKITAYENAIKLNGSNSNVYINTGLIVSSNSSAIEGGTGTLYLGSDDYQIYNGYTTIDNLQIITTSTSTYAYGVDTSINLRGGFVGATSQAKAVGASSWGGGNMFDASITYNSTTYNGYGAPIAATIGSTEYGTLKQAVAALTSSSQTIKLKRDVNECITISSTVTGTIDLNGYTWSCTGNALRISGSSNTSNITITDTSSSVGTITSSSSTIYLSFKGTLYVSKGKIIATGASSAISVSSYASTINIGDSSSTTSNLQILNTGSGSAIYSTVASTINVNNGLIVGKIYGISVASSSATLNIGTTYSNSNTLQVFTTSTSSSYYGVYTGSSTTFNFKVGFIGHAGFNMHGYSYNNVPTSPYKIISTASYNGTTVYGYKAGYASLNSVYYGSLQYAVNALPTSSSDTSKITLCADITEKVTISSTKYGTINLNGFTWTGSGNALALTGSSNKSNITITDNSSSVGTITATSDAITMSFTGTLNILKGMIQTTNTSTGYAAIWNTGAATINIGDSSSTTSNLQILNTTGGHAIYSSAASTININNGSVLGKAHGVYSSSSSATVNIGTTYTTSNSLEIYSVNTTSSYYGVYATGTLNFNCGTVGSAYSDDKVFSKTPTLLSGGGYIFTSSAFSYINSNGNGVSVKGYIRKTGAAYDSSNVYYGSLSKAVENATSSSTFTINLNAKITEPLTISNTIELTINLNGKAWLCGSTSLSITGGTDNTATITITDTSSDSSVGSISSTLSSNPTIDADFAGTLNIYRGKIASASSSSIFYTNANNITVNIGNSSSNETNLQVYTLSSSGNGIYITPGANVGSTLTINGGLIKGNKAIYAVGKSTININKGILIGTGSNAITAMNFDSGSPTVVVGNSTATSSTVKIISSAESNEIPAISVSGSSSVYATLTINGGFIGEISSYNRASHIITSYTNQTINGELGDALIDYDEESYEGNVVYAASVKSGSTTIYYESIPDAFSTLNTSTKTIKLLRNYNGSITLNNVAARIDLNGKEIYNSDVSTLQITGSSSSIIITDTSGDVGKITLRGHSSSYYAITLNGGSLSIYKGIISGGDKAIYASSGTLSIGSYDDGNMQNLQVTADIWAIETSNSTRVNIYKGNIGAVCLDGGTTYIGTSTTSNISNLKVKSIDVSKATVSILRGAIVGDDYAIWASSNSIISIGDGYSSPDDLKIIAKNSNAYAIKSYSSTINISGGFMGASSGSSFAYTKDSNSTLTVYGELVDATTTYDGITYSGKTVAAASIGDTYYYSLRAAFDALPTAEPSTYPILKILGNRNENVGFSTTRYGIVDLNGKMWTGGNSMDVLYISGGNSNASNITITDYSGSIGSISGNYNAITASFAGNLKLYKGRFSSSQYTISSSGTLTIGDSSSTTDNLKISSTTTRYSTISVSGQNSTEKATLIINNGTIEGAASGTNFTILLTNADAYIYKGKISGAGESVIKVNEGVALVIGDSSSTTSNLVLSGGSSSCNTIAIIINATSSNKANVTINGGSINGCAGAISAYEASLNIIGGEINDNVGLSNVDTIIGNENTSNGPSIYRISTSDTITMYGGTIISIQGNPELTMYNGTIGDSTQGNTFSSLIMYGGIIHNKLVIQNSLLMYAGIVDGYIVNDSGYSPTITIGVVNDDYYSSADRLKIIDINQYGNYAITLTSGTFIFNRGFIGHDKGSSYAYSLGSSVSTIIGDVFNCNDTYDSGTYGGKAIAVAHIGSTKYKTLSEAFDALNSTTKTIVLDGNVDESINVFSTINVTVDLHGNKWKTVQTKLTPLVIAKEGNKSYITITDSSSSNSGELKAGSTNKEAIAMSCYSSSTSNCFEGTVKLIKGNIYGVSMYAGYLIIGDSTSTSNNLHILRNASTYAISVGAMAKLFTYNGGFIGSATSNNYNYTYLKGYGSVEYTVNGIETNTAITYDGTTYYGTKLYVAHNETTSTYYETLKDAFNDLSSTKTTKLWLDGNRNEYVSVNTNILVEIDLRGHTWTSGLYSDSESTITITDTSSNVGTIDGELSIWRKTTINIYKGILISDTGSPLRIYENSVVNIGNSESTDENLKIIGNTSAMYILDNWYGGSPTINMYGGLIKAVSFGIEIDCSNYFKSIFNLYGGTIIATKGIFISGSSSFQPTSNIKITIGNSKSTPNNLKIVSTSDVDFGIDVSHTYTSPISLVINSGFIGSLDSSYGHTYDASSNVTVTINGEKINSTTTIDSTTYYGFFVAVAHIGDTYYTSLQDAFDALNETTTTDTTIVLDGNPNECVSFSTTKYGTVDLNGKTWTCTNANSLLEITGGSANESYIIITDNSDSIGSMIASVENIRAKFGGFLEIHRGNLQAQYYVISASDGATIHIGNSNTTDSDVVLTNSNSVPTVNLGDGTVFIMYHGTINAPSIYSSAAGISAYNARVSINRGIINSASYAINAQSNSSVRIGHNYSNIDNLKVISTSESYETIYLASGSTFTYVGGFISDKVSAYTKNVSGVTYDIRGTEMDTSVSYDGTTYSGITLAAASIGDTYYVYLQDAFDALTSSSTDTTIKLEKTLSENVTVTSKSGIVDLNGKTWYSLSSVPGATILTLNSSSNITITSSDSNEYGGEIINKYGNSILVGGTSTLKVLKGMIQGKYAGIVSTGDVIIGDREETSNNIKIIGGNNFYAVNTTDGTLVVNGGIITSDSSAIYSTNTKININKGIIYSERGSGAFASSGTTLVVGNMESTVSDLLIFTKGSTYGVYLSGTSSNKTSFTFVGGFIGSANGYSYAYSTDGTNVTYTINGETINTTASYDSVSYTGKTPVVAHIGYTYYNSLEKAFNDLNENTSVDTTIVLDANIDSLTIQDIETDRSYTISGCITISTTKIGTIDLNGKTWYCDEENQSNLRIIGGSSNLSNITITDNSSGEIGAIKNGSSQAIYANYDGILNIYNGYINSYGSTIYIYECKVNVTLGNSTTKTLLIETLDEYGTAIDIVGDITNKPTLLINGASIYGNNSQSNISEAIGIGASYASVNINKGEIYGSLYAIKAGTGTSLTIGSSTESNIKIENTSSGLAIDLEPASEAIINSGTIIGATGIILSNSDLTINGGAITGSASTAISARDTSNVDVNGGTITSESTYAVQISYSYYGMSGGTVTGVNGIQLDNQADINITGGTIIGNGTNGVGIYTIDDIQIEVTDATIQGSAYGILSSGANERKIIINSGSITGNVGIQAEEIYMIDMSGGTITGTGSYAINMISGDVLMYEGGTLIGSRDNKYSYYYGENVSAEIYYEEYTIINSDNRYETNLVKEKVASLSNGDSYYKLSEAIENAKVGDTITILQNITPSEKDSNTIVYTIRLNKNITIDLNGKTINNYLFSMNANTNLFVWIADDVKIVGTGNIVSYSTTLKNVIRVDAGSLTLGDINEEYSEELIVTSNFGYAVFVTGNSASFIYNSGKLVVNSSNSTYSNIYYNAGRFVTRDGYHVEMTHVNNVHTARLVKGSIINDNNQLDIIYKEVSGSLHIIVKSNKENRDGVETISLDIAKRVKSGSNYYFEYANNSCEITDTQCETIIENEEIAYLYNVTYTNELVIRYVNTDSDGLVTAEESIQKDLTISPEAGDSASIYNGENSIISDGDILLLNVKDASTINSNMKDNRDSIYNAIFGKHWSNIIKTISDPGDVSTCSASSGSICTNLTSMTFTATYNGSSPQPAEGIVFKKLVVYNYAPKLNENVTVTQNVVCEYGSTCEASELVFMDYKGNKVENVENVITLNGEVVDSIDTTKLGNYVVTTYAIDDYGYRSNNIVRTYTVVDNEAPIIEVSDETIYVEKGHGLKNLDVKAYDNHDKDVTVEVITSNVNFNKKGTYTITYKATDSSGNTTLIYRTVVVRNTTEVVLYSIIGVLTLIILVMGFILLKRKRRLNV